MSRALEDLGPHLLGRVPSTPDSRNYQLETFLSTDPVDVALAKLLADSKVARGTKTWAQFEAPYLKAVNINPPVPPSPPPPPAPAGVVWEDPEVTLDQGQTPHCIGFGGCQWGNTLPVDDQYENSDGHNLYYACKVIDGEPKAEDGSSVHTLAKALKSWNRLNVYAWAGSTDTIKQFVTASGPVIVGTDWYDGMFDPDASHYVYPTGAIAGGHCYLLLGYHPQEDAFEFLNSWGAGWGDNGHFLMKVSDFAKLLADNGEALAAVEL